MKQIKLIVREVFGREVFYPACDLSRMICELTGQKSIDSEDLGILKRYGYSVELEPYKKK